MKAEDVDAYLRTACLELTGYDAEFGRDRGIPYVRLRRPDEPTVWAYVSTPGSMWYCLAVTGDFLLIDLTDDDPPDDEVMQSVDDLLVIAHSYLTTRPRPEGTIFPRLTVETPFGKKVLTRSLVSDLRALVPGARRRPGR